MDCVWNGISNVVVEGRDVCCAGVCDSANCLHKGFSVKRPRSATTCVSSLGVRYAVGEMFA